jgi:hypothetical protein
MIVVPEPKFRVGRSGGCDQSIGSPLRPYPAQVVDLAGRRRNAANRTAVHPRLPCSTGASVACHLLNTQLGRRSCPHKRARQELDAGHIPSDGHLPEKSRRLAHPPLQHSS